MVRVVPTGRWQWRLTMGEPAYGWHVVRYVYGSRDRAERKARQLLKEQRAPFEVSEEGADP